MEGGQRYISGLSPAPKLAINPFLAQHCFSLSGITFSMWFLPTSYMYVGLCTTCRDNQFLNDLSFSPPECQPLDPQFGSLLLHYT